MALLPDTKDWTWVLERRCPECGFDATALSGNEVSAVLADNAVQWRIRMSADDVRLRKLEDVWSPLEYACHVRDVLALAQERILLMLNHEHPAFANWDQDATAIAARYELQDPDLVAQELLSRASELVELLDAIEPPSWSRSGVRSNGSIFTIDSFARYMLHDVVHHLYDVD